MKRSPNTEPFLFAEITVIPSTWERYETISHFNKLAHLIGIRMFENSWTRNSLTAGLADVLKMTWLISSGWLIYQTLTPAIFFLWGYEKYTVYIPPMAQTLVSRIQRCSGNKQQTYAG